MIVQPIRLGKRRATLLAASKAIEELQGNAEWPDYFHSEMLNCNKGHGAAQVCAQPGGKLSGNTKLSPKWGPFWLYGTAPCSSLVTRSLPELKKLAEEDLYATIDSSLESVFWSGEQTLNSALGVPTQYPVMTMIDGVLVNLPSLSSSAIDIGGGAASPLLNVLEALEKKARKCGAKGPLTFHTPSWNRSRFFSLQVGLTQIGDVHKFGDNNIVFGEGYGETIGSLTAAATGQAWVVVTSEVQAAVHSTLKITPDEVTLDGVRQNMQEVRAERLAAYRFDTCCVFAALAETC